MSEFVGLLKGGVPIMMLRDTLTESSPWAAELTFHQKHLPAHLAALKEYDKLRRVLGRWNFLERKLVLAGPMQLIADFDLILAQKSSFQDSAQRNHYRLLRDTLRGAAAILDMKPHELLTQLMARLGLTDDPDLQALMAKGVASQRRCWLRPISPSLALPDNGVTRTILAQASPDMDVILSENGRRAVYCAIDSSIRVWQVESEAEPSIIPYDGDVYARDRLLISNDTLTAVVATRSEEHPREQVQVFDLKTGPRGKLGVHSLPDSTLIPLGTDPGTPIAISGDGKTLLYPVATESISLLRPLGNTSVDLGEFHGVSAICFRHGENELIVGCSDGAITGLDIADGFVGWTLNTGLIRISSLATDDEGTHLLCLGVAAERSTVQAWDLRRRVLIHTFDSSVSSVAIASDGKKGFGLSEGDLTIWNLTTGLEERIELQLRRGTARDTTVYENGAAVSADGRRAISAAFADDVPTVIQAIDTVACKEITSFEVLAGHGKFVLSGDGRRVVIAHGHQFQGSLSVWDVDSGARLKEVRKPSGAVHWLAANATGDKVWVVISRGPDNHHELIGLDVESGDIEFTIPVRSPLVCADSQFNSVAAWTFRSALAVNKLLIERPPAYLEGHAGPISSMALNGDGNVAISAGTREIKVWDVGVGTLLSEFQIDGNLSQILLSVDGATALLVSRNYVLALDVRTGKIKGKIASSEGRRSCLSGDGNQAAMFGYANVLIWDIQANSVCEFDDSSRNVTSAALNVDGSLLLTASSDSTISISDVKARCASGRTRQLPHTTVVGAVAISADGTRAASMGRDGVRLWSTQKLHSEQLLTFAIEIDRYGLVMSADGRTLLVADRDHTNVFDCDTRKQLSDHGDKTNPEIDNFCSMTADGSRAISGFGGGPWGKCSVTIWDVLTGRDMLSLPMEDSSPVSGVAMSRDGSRGITSCLAPDEVKVWDLKTGVERKTGFRFQGLRYEPFALSGDGSVLLGKCSDSDENGITRHAIGVWDVDSGLLKHKISNSENSPCIVAINHSGRFCAVVSYNPSLTRYPERQVILSELRVWDLWTESLLSTFTSDAHISSASLSADGMVIVCGDANGSVHFLRLEGMNQDD